MSMLMKIRSEKILNTVNFMSVGEKDITRSGYYTFRFKDRHNNQLIQEYKLEPCQRLVTYSQITAKTGYDKFKVRRSFIDLERQGKIKLKKIYKVIKGWTTKEIIGHIVTLIPISITIKPLSLEKRKIKGQYIAQKSVTPRDCLQTDRSAKNATLNIYLNNNHVKKEFNISTLGLNIKSEDIDILDNDEYEKILEFNNFNTKAKEAIKKIKTLNNQKKSILNKELKISIILNKQNKINQISNIMNLSQTAQILKTTAFDINPKGREITLNDKIEMLAIKVDENNLIPSKYKNQFLKMNEHNQNETVKLYFDLNNEIKMINSVEKRKLISSIMMKYWKNQLSIDKIQKYIVEIKRIRSSHYKEQRIIYDYWGLFNKEVCPIGNKNSVNDHMVYFGT